MEQAVAGAVVGATIKVVLQNLITFHVDEIGRILNVKKDLQKLKQSIVMIQDFLEDAEMKQVTDKPVQRWLMNLEAVAFDADYVFDQLNYHLLSNKVEMHNKLPKKVSSFFSPSNPLAFRRKMAGKIKEIKKELKSINKEASGLGLQMRTSSAHARGAETDAPGYLETDSFSVDPVFVGRENDVAKILEMVTTAQTQQAVLTVLPIVGMAGLGKTTLTRKVFSDGNIFSHFGNRVWVHVGKSFDPVIVLRKTLESLTEENVEGSREVVLKKLRESLGEKKYLLVLDDVWNEDNDKWNNFIASLKGISFGEGNVIMVTTRSGNVASTVKTRNIHELGVLSEEDCWLIIKAGAFGREDVPAEFEKIGRNIVKTCAGLPLAAQVVGSLFRGKLEDEWVSIEKNWLSDSGEDENAVSKSLKLSFDNLSSPLLKKCFAYCSIIPKGWFIEREELIELWIAEGFLQSDKEKDMEIVGKNVFNILIQSSLLQVWRTDLYGNVKQCRLHDLVHDFSLSVLNPKSPSPHRHLSIPLKNESCPISKEHAKYLRALFYNGKVSQNIFSNFQRVHVLILMGDDINELPFEIEKLICLRYLDISHTKMESLPDSIGHLYHLQTLRATRVYGGEGCLRRLPDTFKFLSHLRHLYIPNIKLPREIRLLISIQTLPYFQVNDEEGCGIMELGSLNNLKGAIEIHNLEKVRDKEDAKSANLFHKQNISKLKLVWNGSQEGEANDENVLEGLQPHHNLKRLEIEGFKGKSFPLWTLQMSVKQDLEHRWIRLDNLLEVILSDCKHCEEIPMLGHLPRLKSVSLRRLSSVKSMGSSFYDIKENENTKEMIDVFPALKKLELVDMVNLTVWTEVELSSSIGTQPHEAIVFGGLECLKITNCRQLISAPSHFPCLKELEIDNMESCLPLANICGSKLTTLTKLKICNVDGLVCLPEGLFNNNRDLSELEIRTCHNMLYLVSCLRGGGSSLKKLVIDNCLNFNEFLEDLHTLNSLEDLRMHNCPNLKSIPYPSGTHLSSQGFTSLRDLHFFECSGLTNLPCEMLESCALSLQWLRLTGSTSLTNLPQVMSILQKMPRLTNLGIEVVPKVKVVVAEIGSLHNLETLFIGGYSDFQDYVSFTASLDHIFPALPSLGVLRLYGMKEWDAIPEQLLQLTTLYSLMIFGFGIEVLPEWIGSLPSLTDLRVCGCPNLRRLASKTAMLRLTDFEIFQCPLLEQNVEQEASDSEWHKISHIRRITVDRRPFYGHHAR